jgi:hypothetical protein
VGRSAFGVSRHSSNDQRITPNARRQTVVIIHDERPPCSDDRRFHAERISPIRSIRRISTTV